MSPSVFSCRGPMEVLSGPWADVALLLRQTMAQTDGLSIYLLWLLVFLSVCLLLLQMIIYLSWKLRQGRESLTFYGFKPLTESYLQQHSIFKWILTTHEGAL